MAENETDETGLSERVVKEAVGKGMETSMREPIVEAVEDADDGGVKKRRVPLTGAIMGLGVAVGYILGSRRKGDESQDEPVEDLIDQEGGTEEVEEAETAQAETEDDEDSGGSRLRKLAVVAGIAGLIALLRRRRSSEETEEWEPIEEFEPAVEPEDGSTTDGDEGDDVGVTAGEDEE